MLLNSTVSAWDSYSLNNSSFGAVIPPEAAIVADAQIISAQRPANTPVFGGKSFGGRTLPLHVTLKGDLDTRMTELTGWGMLSPYDNQLHKLHVIDSTGKDWYVLATVSGLPRLVGNVLVVHLYLPDPVWKSNTVNVTPWPVTGNNDKQVVTVAGNMPALPVFKVTPTGSGSAGFAHRRFVVIYNRTRKTLENWPIEITGGGLNTQSLVSAGHMQADGDDIRIMRNGAFDNYWMSSATPGSDTALKIWDVATIKPMIEMTLGVSIPSSGAVGEITIKSTSANKSLLSELEVPGLVQIGTEIFATTAKNTKTMKIAVAERAARDTAMAAHAVGDTVRWLPFDMWLLYGDATATAPEIDNTRKPAFSLNSTNAQWIYTEFGDEAGLRAGAWKRTVLKSTGKLSRTYSGDHGDDLADPATELGMEINAWQKNGKWQGETASIECRLDCPVGIAQIAASGEKRRSTASFPSKARLEKFTTKWSTVWSETSPVSEGTWTPWNRAAVATSGAPTQARFLFDGSIGAAADNQANFEVDAVTVDLVSANTPSVTLAAEQSNTWLNGAIVNNRTGEKLEISYPMKLNNTLTIDTARQVVELNGAVVKYIPKFNSDRLNWLPLLPPNAAMGVTGANELEWVSPGTGNASISVEHQDRTSV